MAKKPSASVQRVRDILKAAGIEGEVRELASSTRTAAEAAAAVDCQVGQIVKSLVVKGQVSNRLLLVLTSGANRLCVAKVAGLAGEEVAMADAASVREQTGFAIGGIPPVGHLSPMPAFIDEELLRHEVIWAAAGSPHALFCLSADDLLRLTGGRVADIAE